jgi:hypothetical protein
MSSNGKAGAGRSRGEERTVAVLVDADNASAQYAKAVLEEAARFGRVTIRRMYGDWTSLNLSKWKGLLHELGIEPVQQFAHAVGKNATDVALVIDAMDLLHDGRAEVFCLVTSDSDFTRLASRLRENGCLVVGFGRRGTPQAFVRRCDEFLFVEELQEDQERGEEHLAVLRSDESLRKRGLATLTRAFDICDKGEDLVQLVDLGPALSKMDPGFSLRSYGFAKLRTMIKAYPDVFTLELDEQKRVLGVSRVTSEDD